MPKASSGKKRTTRKNATKKQKEAEQKAYITGIILVAVSIIFCRLLGIS
jgi:hypothetical protein